MGRLRTIAVAALLLGFASFASAQAWEYAEIHAWWGDSGSRIMFFISQDFTAGGLGETAMEVNELLGEEYGPLDGGRLRPFRGEIYALNLLGRDGWELVSTTSTPLPRIGDGEPFDTLLYLLRRPVSE